MIQSDSDSRLCCISIAASCLSSPTITTSSYLPACFAVSLARALPLARSETPVVFYTSSKPLITLLRLTRFTSEVEVEPLGICAWVEIKIYRTNESCQINNKIWMKVITTRMNTEVSRLQMWLWVPGSSGHRSRTPMVALDWQSMTSLYTSVQEYIFYVFFFRFQKNMTFYVFLMMYQKVVKSR